MKKKITNKPLYCDNDNHEFVHVDVTPRYQQLSVTRAEVAPDYKLYCVKCGEIRNL